MNTSGWVQSLWALAYACSFPLLLGGIGALVHTHVVHGLGAVLGLLFVALTVPTGISCVALGYVPGRHEPASCGRRFLFELNLWMTAFFFLVLLSTVLLRFVQGIVLQAVIGLTPVVPAFGILNAVMGAYRASDERERKIIAESIMFAFGATAILTFSYGFLQGSVHAPMLSYLFVWPVLAATWGVGIVIAQRRYS
ncbi:MAG TPA: hypothetical protein VME66_07390 [Candidatus Acidoferrales bacterium]|nr:hypothetical protein [Candidatus Acidoferrales bacterium]